MDLISVIIPVYKVERYLDCCVESVVTQTYSHLEIILVDDGSPDRCPMMCEEWAKKDRRIRVIHKANGGLSDARNAGLAVAMGEYISFIDSDDWVDKHFIEYLRIAMRQTKSDLAACDVCFVRDGENAPLVREGRPNPVKNTPEYALATLIMGQEYRAVAWNKLYRKELLTGELFEVGKLHEDEFFSYRLFDKCSSLSYIDIPLYFYRQREDSIMTTYSARHLDALEAHSRRLELLKQKYPCLYEKDKIIFCISCLNQYCEASRRAVGNKAQALQRIKKFRAQIRFSICDWAKQSFKNKIYVIGSTNCFIDIVAYFRNIMRIE